jgi:hypothetical protein
MMALALFLLIFLNTVFLGFIKSDLSAAGASFVFVAAAYLLVSFFSLFFFIRSRQLFSWNALGWAIGVAGVFCLYNTQTLQIFPGDIIIAQLTAPYIAMLIIEKKVGWNYQDALPTVVLCLIALARLFLKPQHHAWTLVVILLMFLITQYNLRKLSLKNQLPSLLTFGNGIVALILLVAFYAKGHTISEISLPWTAFLITALLVYCLEFLFVKILRELSPMTSATIIASSLPLSILYETLVLKKENVIELWGCGIYFAAIIFKLIRKPSLAKV